MLIWNRVLTRSVRKMGDTRGKQTQHISYYIPKGWTTSASVMPDTAPAMNNTEDVDSDCRFLDLTSLSSCDILYLFYSLSRSTTINPNDILPA